MPRGESGSWNERGATSAIRSTGSRRVPALVIVNVLPSWTLLIALVLSSHVVVRLLTRVAAASEG